MAGAGYKLFNTGDVLTAAQVNEYLMQQTVMVFADSSARTTALSGVLAEGMLSYLKSDDKTYAYNGSAWVAVGGSSPLTTKGDLYTYSTADTRLAVGTTNGHVLQVDSTAATGMKWAAAPAANKSFSLINTGGTTLSGTSTGVTGLSGYDTLILLISNGSTTTNSAIELYINNDNSNLYGNAGAIVNMNSTYAAGNFTSTGSASGTANRWDLGQTGGAAAIFSTAVTITGANSTGGKGVQSIFGTDTSGGQLKWIDGVYLGSSVVSSLYISTGAGTFDAGKIYVYGSVA